ncbi:aminoglycoside phosphotransferase family protein [Actinopolymorpha sp. B9G3]|uniref:aminoglycoside phosphotransferase family protein n=1 Tax=Actinopolymorpha sp. B9G3 TaxID=3158970 RepID=UPI0032D91EE6
MTRKVTLVLLDKGGEPLGSLPPYTVETPWWPEVGEVVDTARALWNIDVVVLRTIGPPDRSGPPGGEVTYVAEVDPASRLPTLAPADERAKADVEPHPYRAPWASPGGPAATTAWATAALEARGVTPTAFVQRKSWNLSAIWRVETAESPLWLKQVPTFFAHEPALLRWLGAAVPGVATELIVGEGGRALLAHVPGEDRFGASAAELREMLTDLHRIQAYAADRIEELLDLGVPGRRNHLALPAIQTVAARYGPTLEPALRTSLDTLVDGLPERFAEVAACGLPDTLVHGDFQGGNVRSDDKRRVIIDWGDSTIGDPTMDIARAIGGLPDADRDTLVNEWAARWRSHTPGCDPARALQLMLPVVDLLYAVVYTGFLDQIEPSEWPYHRDDPPDCLRSAVRRADLIAS